jgi:glutamyl-tRNA synthetase
MTQPILKILKERDWIDNRNYVLGQYDAESYVAKVVMLDARNYTDASAFVERNRYFFQAPAEQDLLKSRPSGHLHHISRDISALVHQDQVLQQILTNFELISADEWTMERIRDCINAVITEQTEQSLKTLEDGYSVDLEAYRKSAIKSWSKLIHSHIRWAIAAGLPGPDGAGSMGILGKEETLSRYRNAARVLTIEQINGHLDQGAKATEINGTM